MSFDHHKTLRLILGDQLNITHTWFNTVDKSITYLMMEVRSETDYSRHHIQKVIAFFASMQQFARELQEQGHQVIYMFLNDETNFHRFDQNCLYWIEKDNFTRFEYQLPDEYRVDEHLKSFVSKLTIPSKVFDTEHFYTSRKEFSDLFQPPKSIVMETFYRYMRKKHNVLMDEDNKPLNGKWNFDQENRKKIPKSHKIISPLLFSTNLKHIELEIIKSNIITIGSVDSEHFIWPISRTQSLQLLDFFANHCLPYFGSFQDAMAANEWSIYHSRLSYSLNIKLISPKEVVDKVIEVYTQHQTEIEYHQVEGFVRQIIGWREYMRGIYWLNMPNFAQLNFFNHTTKLPSWFWTGETKMTCLSSAINQSLDFAYAHHIQRLMITGNFALLAGVHPDDVDDWYLGIYIDAIEWVEITNTRGMSQFADGGIVGTKPYVSSASYINKMSSYCESCYYNASLKTGDKACPFNSLYWSFFERHKERLSNNPRLGMMYAVWKKMNPSVKKEILNQAEYYLNHINEL